MTNKRLMLFFVLSICILSWRGLCQTQSEAMAYDERRAEIYGDMLGHGNAENYLMILELLPSVAEITDEIKSRFGVDVVSEIDTAVGSKNRERVLLALYKMVFYDIKNIFATITESGHGLSPEEVRSLLKTAGIDYSLLSPKVKAISLTADNRIRELFQWAIFMVPTEKSSPFTQAGQKEMDAKLLSKLTKLMEKVEQECLKAFPDLGG